LTVDGFGLTAEKKESEDLNSKSQIPNTKQIPNSNPLSGDFDQMTQTKKMSFQGAFVLVIGIWSLEFIWNLVFGAWYFILTITSSSSLRPSTVHRKP
jgi:hypothetical protein